MSTSQTNIHVYEFLGPNEEQVGLSFTIYSELIHLKIRVLNKSYCDEMEVLCFEYCLLLCFFTIALLEKNVLKLLWLKDTLTLTPTNPTKQY